MVKSLLERQREAWLAELERQKRLEYQLRESLETLKKKNNEQDESIEKHDKQLTEIDRQLETIKTEISNINSDIANLAKEGKLTKEALAEYKGKMSLVLNGIKEDFFNEIAKINQKTNALAADDQAINKRYVELRSFTEVKIDFLNKEIARLDIKDAALSKLIKELTNEMNDAKQSIDYIMQDLATIKNEVVNINSDIANLATEGKLTKEALAEYKGKMSLVLDGIKEDFFNEIAKINQKTNALAADDQAINKRYVELRIFTEVKIDFLNKEIARLDIKDAALSKLIKELTNEMNDAKQNITNIISDLEIIRAEVSNAKKDSLTKGELTDYKISMERVLKDIENKFISKIDGDLALQKKSFDITIDAFKNEINQSIKENNTSSQNELNKIKTDLYEKIEETNKSINKITSSIENFNNKLDSFSKELNAIKQSYIQNKGLPSIKADVENRLDNFEKLLWGDNSWWAWLTGDGYDGEITILDKKISQLSKMLNDQKKSITEAISDNKALKKELDSLFNSTKEIQEKMFSFSKMMLLNSQNLLEAVNKNQNLNDAFKIFKEEIKESLANLKINDTTFKITLLNEIANKLDEIKNNNNVNDELRAQIETLKNEFSYERLIEETLEFNELMVKALQPKNTEYEVIMRKINELKPKLTDDLGKFMKIEEKNELDNILKQLTNANDAPNLKLKVASMFFKLEKDELEVINKNAQINKDTKAKLSLALDHSAKELVSYASLALLKDNNFKESKTAIYSAITLLKENPQYTDIVNKFETKFENLSLATYNYIKKELEWDIEQLDTAKNKLQSEGIISSTISFFWNLDNILKSTTFQFQENKNTVIEANQGLKEASIELLNNFKNNEKNQLYLEEYEEIAHEIDNLEAIHNADDLKSFTKNIEG